jgi:hypothetical protein
MQTLSKGYKRPDTGDRGSVWFNALADNVSRINLHDHDGVNSELLQSKSIQKTTQTISSAGWGLDLGGSTYRQTITMPSGWTYDNAILQFRDSAGEMIFPTVAKASATSYTITVNDNTLTVTAIYG